MTTTTTTTNNNTNNTNNKQQLDAASAEIQAILGARRRPKHVGDGLASGASYMVQAGVGAAGVAVLMPAVGAAEGHGEMGLVGGLLGGVGGMVGGVVQGVNLLGEGVVTGMGQVVRGALATPDALRKPRQGHWWNATQGKWVRTDLLQAERWMATQAEHDEDVLGEDVLPDELKQSPLEDQRVKDTYYYDLLGLDPSVDSQMIKRRYFIVARKYSPDRAGANPKAQTEFQQIGRTYMILMNDELRAKYDCVGKDNLWKEEEEEEETPDVDPNLLYMCLFGSEKFSNYIGRLVAATAARVGEDQSRNLTPAQAQLLQQRRVTRLALALAARLVEWAEDDLPQSARATWMTEAEFLSDASFGIELLHLIGKVYTLAAIQFLGSLESGIGMPSISRWARKHVECMKVGTQQMTKHVKNVGGDRDMLTLQQTVGTAVGKTDGDAKLEVLAKDILKKSSLQETAINAMWTQTVVDVTNTLHEAAQMVLHDQNVDKTVRKKRGEALQALGEVFINAKPTKEAIPEQPGLEEIAFHAMLDTVWRHESNARYDDKASDEQE